MTALDDALIPVVLQLITDFGKDMTFTVISSESFDASTGSVTTTDSTVTIKGSPPSPYEERYIDGDLIQDGDAEVFIASSGLTFTPENGQVVTFDSERWVVQKVGKVFSGESIAAYRLQLRK